MRAFPYSRANGLSCGAMSKPASLLILGILLLAAGSTAGAAPSPSNWPSLDMDAAHSNYNTAETTLTARNVLKLKVKWTAPETNLSYPIVAGGSVYVPVLERTRHMSGSFSLDRQDARHVHRRRAGRNADAVRDPVHRPAIPCRLSILRPVTAWQRSLRIPRRREVAFSTRWRIRS